MLSEYYLWWRDFSNGQEIKQKTSRLPFDWKFYDFMEEGILTKDVFELKFNNHILKKENKRVLKKDLKWRGLDRGKFLSSRNLDSLSTLFLTKENVFLSL